MQATGMCDHLRDRMFEISPEEFEIFCKMVLVRRLKTKSLQVTAFRQDEGIDIEGVLDEDILQVLLGVQVKRYTEGNTVGSRSIQAFRGALTQGNHQVGSYITSGSFTKPAIDAAEELQISLVDGELLASVMVENQIGVEKSNGSYAIQEEFWKAFDEPEQDDLVPSNEVPLADSFETLRSYLRAIEATDGSESEMHRYVNDELGQEFAQRHANMNGVAAWLLGFAHKETPKQMNGREVRRWGLTRDGVKYLTLSEEDNTAQARRLLENAIREVEIIRRIYAELEADGELTYAELRKLIEQETHVSGASVNRRGSTIANWLAVLSEVEVRPDSRSKKFVRV